MAYGDRIKSIDEGNNSEQLFAVVMKSHGWKVRSATMAEQYKHIDFLLDKNDVHITVDVKAKKRLSSKDDNFLTGWLWVEIAGQVTLAGYMENSLMWLFTRKMDL